MYNYNSGLQISHQREIFAGVILTSLAQHILLLQTVAWALGLKSLITIACFSFLFCLCTEAFVF